MADTPTPPVAEARPWSYTLHGLTVEDPYRWLKDDSFPAVDDQDVLAYLQAENAYSKAIIAPLRELVETIYGEIEAREQPDDADVPVKDGPFYYQGRFAEGAQYRIWSRWPAQDAGAEQGPTGAAHVILDETSLATGVGYFRRGAFAVSNDARLLAYSADTSGAERFTLRIKDLDSGELLDDVIHDTQGRAVWAADDAVLFYTVVDEQGRAYQVRRHVVGNSEASDAVVYEEKDTRFFVGVSLTSSKDYVVIHTADHVTSEAYLIPAADPSGSRASYRRAAPDTSTISITRATVSSSRPTTPTRMPVWSPPPMTIHPSPPGRRWWPARTSITSVTSPRSRISSSCRNAWTGWIRSVSSTGPARVPTSGFRSPPTASTSAPTRNSRRERYASITRR